MDLHRVRRERQRRRLIAMPKEMLECKVCGARYEACRTPNTLGVFRWRDVACCKEHGQIYLESVMEARRIAKMDEPKDDTD